MCGIEASRHLFSPNYRSVKSAKRSKLEGIVKSLRMKTYPCMAEEMIGVLGTPTLVTCFMANLVRRNLDVDSLRALMRSDSYTV